MCRKIFENLFGVLSLIFLCAYTLCFCLPILAVAVIKFVIPLRPWRRLCTHVLNRLMNGWALSNKFWSRVTRKVEWEITGLEKLNPKECYLVVANHQSWLDVVVVQNLMVRRIAPLKFFIKDSLKWVPVMGLVWWALDFPFMKRYSKELLLRKPHLKGRDLASTLKACDKVKEIPTSIMNFVEGTRFTMQKKLSQHSPFNNLLKPKAGGVATVLTNMGDQIKTLVDITIVYPKNSSSLWDFLCARIRKINVNIRVLPIAEDMSGDYLNDNEYRQKVQQWINQIWEQKQAILSQNLLS